MIEHIDYFMKLLIFYMLSNKSFASMFRGSNGISKTIFTKLCVIYMIYRNKETQRASATYETD